MRVAYLLPILVPRILVLPILRLLAGGILLAAPVGCGETSQDTSESVASPSAETPLELLQRSNTVMATVGSFRARTTIEGTSMGQELEVSLETDVGDNQWTHTRMSIKDPGEGSDEAIELEQVLTGEHAYTKVTDQGPTWVRMDLEALAELAGLPPQSQTNPLGLYTGLFPGDGVPWEAYSVQSAGLRRIFGVKTEHLQIDLDFQEVWAALNPEQQEQWQQSLALDGDAGELIEQLQYESIDIWIDVSGYVRQLKMALTAGDETSLEVDMVLTDLGKRIDIEEPKEYVDVP